MTLHHYTVTRNSAIADKPYDAFISQSRSPNMLPFHMLGMVSHKCAIVVPKTRHFSDIRLQNAITGLRVHEDH